MLNHWIFPGGCPGFLLWGLGSEAELLRGAGSGPLERGIYKWYAVIGPVLGPSRNLFAPIRSAMAATTN